MGAVDGKVAIVTGGGRGLGRCHALLLASEGARVMVNDAGAELDGSGRSMEPADAVVAQIKEAGGQAAANYEDVTDFQGAKRLVDSAISTFGKLDILVNNAGFVRDRIVFNMPEEDWDAVLAVHLKGTFNCGRWAASYFREQSKAGMLERGRIINTSSHSGLLGNVGQGNYGAAKAGIASLTMIWAMELARINVTCNAIAPMARTRMTEMTVGVPAAVGAFDEFAPENISPVVVYLASDQAQGVTGRIISIRGGKLELFQPWQIGPSIDIGRRWTVREIGERIKELGL
ncbi:MAG: SDR family NAD(P)-dependent oxidoreductase [Dehalococcoidia bacterium]|nr:SDR family NAD(P)-dependent oxidoreductase [Dehalococcoidia bacterium]